MKDIKIPVPPFTEQTALVSAISVLEGQIVAAQSIIASAAGLKSAVMRQYL